MTAATGQDADAARRVARYVYVVASLAAVAYAGALAYFTTVPHEVLLAPQFLGGSAALLAVFLVFQFSAFEFEWRGHRLTANLEETLVFVSLVFLPGPVAVLCVAAAQLLTHVRRGRSRIKGVFNVAHDVVSAAAAFALFTVLTTKGAPTLLAAMPATVLYVTASNFFLAGVFARLERVGVIPVFWERLAPTTALLSVIGIAGGVAVYALAAVHPLALAALVPFAYTLKRNTVLASRADRELTVHRRLGEVSFDLIGTSDLDAVADRVLETCASVLGAGRASLRLDPEEPGGAARAWTRDYDTGPGSAQAGFVVDLPGRDGRPIGELSVYPRAGAQTFGDIEQALARIVAGQAAGAVLSARALLALEDAREEALAQHERLAKQEKLSTLGMLIANVAHEVGNPVTYMRTSLELSLMEAEGLAANGADGVRQVGERIRADVESALKGANRLVEITESLKSVARQGPGGLKRTSVNDIAKDVANVVRVGFPRNVTLEVDLTEEGVDVNANRGELTQVVLNLVKNAAEAIGTNTGVVRVRSRLHGARVHLSIEDNGPGIPDDVKARLFEAFFTTKEKGTGLGLNISRRIVQNHGGEMRLESEVGVGTTFTLDLPLASGDAPADGAGTAAPA